jgi:hypothetical protein
MSDDDPRSIDRQRAAERNLARLSALSSGDAGLVVAAIAHEVTKADRALPHDGSSAAALPGVAVWAWRAGEDPAVIAADLAAARASLGEGTRAVLVLRPRARVVSPPLHGEVGAVVEAVDAVPLVRAVGGLQEDELVRGVDLRWSDAADARVAEAGFVTAPARG